MSEEIKPFKIHVSDAELDDLKRRLRAARLPEKETVDDWSQGVPLAYVKDVCQYWAEKYDWRKTEARLRAESPGITGEQRPPTWPQVSVTALGPV